MKNARKTVQFHVNSSLEDMGSRFENAWHRAEAGQEVRESHIGFFDLTTMLSTITKKRLELLQSLHEREAKDIKSLSSRIHRDYKNVYEDIKALNEAGLVEIDDRGVRVPFDRILAEMVL